MSQEVNIWGGTPTPDLSQEDLSYFSQVIEARAGISLKDSKSSLVRTRLRSRIGANGLTTYQEYREFLQGLPPDHPEWETFTNLLTTNKTDFFREPQHFNYLENVILPEWLKSDAQTFKVWSAASSTGEEAFTLAMILERSLLPHGRDYKILGTDIDTEVISTAQNAVYSLSKKDEIPSEFQTSSLELGRREAQGWFRIKPHLKKKVEFKPHNLTEEASPDEGPFDLVLCRNVLIYFALPTIAFVQKKLFSATKPGGYFFIGHSESLQGIRHDWKSLGSSIFKKGG